MAPAMLTALIVVLIIFQILNLTGLWLVLRAQKTKTLVMAPPTCSGPSEALNKAPDDMKPRSRVHYLDSDHEDRIMEAASKQVKDDEW